LEIKGCDSQLAAGGKLSREEFSGGFEGRVNCLMWKTSERELSGKDFLGDLRI